MSLQRDPGNPILRPADIPAIRPDLVDVSSVFNPGAAMWRGRERLLLRVQTRGRTTVVIPAERRPGGDIEILSRVVEFELPDPRPLHVYDPRLTVIDDRLYAVLACDFPDGCRLLTARTDDFETWETIALDPDGDRRNGVLFPDRIDGRYLRLERPNTASRVGAPPTGSAIVLAASDDLATWHPIADVMAGRPARWDELIGAGPPPLRTRDGWLLVYHGVATHFAAANIYQAGVALLDLYDPARVIARGAFNILEPRESWELAGQVPNVVFPSGMVVEEVDAEGYADPDAVVRLYYGAADTVVGLASTTVAELVADARFEGI